MAELLRLAKELNDIYSRMCEVTSLPDIVAPDWRDDVEQFETVDGVVCL